MENEILLQLLVFEHSTGDVTVQCEVGEIEARFGNIGYQIKAGHLQYKTCSSELMREAIDKAVAEQFGCKPEPPYIELVNKNNLPIYCVTTRAGGRSGLDAGVYQAFCELAGKELPVVDASESQVKSEWKQVFPPEDKDYLHHTVPCGESNLNLLRKIQKETAFTIWRLTVVK